VFLKNVVPTNAVKGMVPYEAWFGRKPNVSVLKVFGYPAYVHVAKQMRNKLAPKSIKCVYVGVPDEEGGFLCFDPDKEQHLASRDVQFDELFQTADRVSGANDSADGIGSDSDSEAESEADSDASEDEEPASVQGVRRSSRLRGGQVGTAGQRVTAVVERDPQTVEEAQKSHFSAEWEEAMKQEYNSLQSNKTWRLVELPPGKKLVQNKWVFQRKMDEQGHVARFKARLVAKGFSQRRGVDYFDTFLPGFVTVQ